MRVTGLDIVVSTVTLLAIAVMIPMPWLLSFSQEANCPRHITLYHAPLSVHREPPPLSGSASITVLYLASFPVKPVRDCAKPTPSSIQHYHNKNP